MTSSFRPVRRPTNVGEPPGIVRPVAAPPGMVHVLAYGPEEFVELDIRSVHQLSTLRPRYPVVWIDVIGHSDPATLTAVRDELGLHALAVEDVVNLGQRPKLEEYAQNLFCVARMMSSDDDELRSEQLSLVLAKGVVLTFQEQFGDCLDTVRDRIRTGGGRIRAMGADYLFYALVDAVVDGYSPPLELIGDRIEEIEERVLLGNATDPITDIHHCKRDLIMLRRAVLPLRDALRPLQREGARFVSADTLLYFRDALDHLDRAADHIDSYRDLANAVMDTHISVVGHRMNDVIGLLTIVSTIFIPLSFLVGLWGMNFDYEVSHWNMPELHLPYAYPIALVLMFGIAGAQLWYFKRRGWLRLGR